MDATPSLHVTSSTSRTTRLIAGAGVTAALFASVLLPVPARAITTETEATLTETQKKVESTAAAYDKASKTLDDLKQQVASNEARIAELESKLPDAQDRASRAMRDIYKKRKDSNLLMSFVMGTESLDNLISGMKYMDQIKDANIDALEDLNAVQTELEAEKTKLNAAKVKAEDEQKSASKALSEAQKLREDAQAKADAEAAAELAALQAAAEEAAKGGEPTGPLSTPDNDAVNWGTDEAAFIAEWTARIDAYLAGSPLEGQGVTFATAAWKYGVDPRFSPAISNTESSKGRHCFLPHNAWGWGSSSWDSWEEAIDDHVAGLARGYGYTISVAGAKKYCPPNWFNWYNNTLAEMEKI